ncbi:MAG: DUF427 domain-containing protein [Rubrobacter sp.]|nr:DUF427 domain-containing protein [Rubrobacter sp.]
MRYGRIEPASGQESVWDYPRPPRMEDVDEKVKVVFGGVTLAYTTRAKRVLETSHPPVYYIPPEDIQMEFLSPSGRTSMCEWKGRARYYDIATEDEITGEKKSGRNAAWFYPEPVPEFDGLRDYVAFYPSKMDACWVGGEKVEAQDGDFYGGWITASIVGPFKGARGTWGW